MKAREGKAAHKRAGGNGATTQAAAQAERRRWESAGGIKQAVKEWCEDGAAALAKYGHISDWDVSGVRDMNELFKAQAEFDDDLSGWDVSSVTNMGYMFLGASSFTSDLSGWDVSSVTDMEDMFDGVSAEVTRNLPWPLLKK